MTRLLLLLVLPLLAADEDAFDRLDAIEAQWPKAVAEVESVLAQRQTAFDAYPGRISMDGLAREDDRLYELLLQAFEKENRFRTEHLDLLKELGLIAAVRAIGRKGGGTDDARFGERMLRAQEWGELSKKRSGELEAMALEIAHRRDGIVEAHSRSESRRKVLFWSGGCLALLVGASLLMFRLGRSREAESPALPPALPMIRGNRFTLGRVIGKGGMGVVYEADDAELKRKVAVKRLRPELVEEPKELERFLSEARLTAQLKHPNIVQIFSVVQEPKDLYLVFEYMEGRTLAAILEEKGSLSRKDSASILEQMAAAVDYAHSCRVIHRDLKPSNVMVSGSGEVKVMDFGIAYQAKETISRLTKVSAWGSPQYMAPEQELGSISKSSDLFALGVCFYEMLTGEFPFKGPNFLAQKREECYPTVPGAEAFFRKALAPEPAKRFGTAAEFAAAAKALG